MEYTPTDYNVTIHRGFVREDGMKLWGIRRYKGQEILDWRDQKTYARDEATKDKCRTDRQRKNRAKVTGIKVTSGCSICGGGLSVFPKSKQKKFYKHVASVLQFDHLDPATKLYNVCDMSGRSWNMIQAEIDKCRVICFPCHTEHTAEQRKRGELS